MKIESRERIKIWILLAILACFAAAGPAAAGQEAMAVLQKPLEEVIKILKDPRYQDDSQKGAQREELFRITRRIFDFTEMSKRTLARNWKKFTPQQRKSFTRAFSQLLENTYINKIQGGFQDEEVVFLEQRDLSQTKALVKTKIVRKSTEIPVDYRMIYRKQNWRAYDIIVEGISLVKNYRTQFKDILTKETPDQLIERLEKKVTELEAA